MLTAGDRAERGGGEGGGEGGQQRKRHSLKRREESTSSQQRELNSSESVLNFDFEDDGGCGDDFDVDEMLSQGGGRSRAASVLNEDEATASFDPNALRALADQRQFERGKKNDPYSPYGKDGNRHLSRQTLDTLQVLDATQTVDHSHHLDDRRHLPSSAKSATTNLLSRSLPTTSSFNAAAAYSFDNYTDGLRAREAEEEAALVAEERQMNIQRRASAVAALAVANPVAIDKRIDSPTTLSSSSNPSSPSIATIHSSVSPGGSSESVELDEPETRIIRQGKEGETSPQGRATGPPTKRAGQRRRRPSGIWRSNSTSGDKTRKDGRLERGALGLAINAATSSAVGGWLADIGVLRGGRRRHSDSVVRSRGGASPATSPASFVPSLGGSPREEAAMDSNQVSPPWRASSGAASASASAAGRQLAFFSSSKLPKAKAPSPPSGTATSGNASSTNGDKKPIPAVADSTVIAAVTTSSSTKTKRAKASSDGPVSTPKLMTRDGKSIQESVHPTNANKLSTSKSAGVARQDFLVKVLLLGDSNVGKTSMMTRAAENVFPQRMMNTAG
jgi:hypothetical protein